MGLIILLCLIFGFNLRQVDKKSCNIISMKNYIIDIKKGQGTYSNVYMATSKQTNEKCAIKVMKNKYTNVDKLKKDKEIQALKTLSHPNIIRMKDVLYDQQQQQLAIVFELMDSNLYQFYKQKKNALNIQKIRSIGHDIIDAVNFMHCKGVFHRDIKPENILVQNDKTFKLADFGSCKSIRSSQPYTQYIATRWYRSPQCLMTDGFYSEKMDIWSIGCVLFELYTHYPLFPGQSQQDQVASIFSILGTPSSSTLQKFKKKSSHMSFDFKKTVGIGLHSLIPQAPQDFLDLLNKMLVIDPNFRINAKQALQHRFFYSLTELKKLRKSIIEKIVQNREINLPLLKGSQSKVRKQLKNQSIHHF